MKDKDKTKEQLIAEIAELKKKVMELELKQKSRAITFKERKEAELKLNHERLEALFKLNQMSDATLQGISDFVYKEGQRLTGSKIGWMGFVNQDKNIIEIISYSHQNKDVHNSKHRKLSIENSGLWAEAIRQCRPIIINDYTLDYPRKKGLPGKHPMLTRFLAVPVIEDDKVVGLTVVANKPTNYDESDVYQLNLLYIGMWKIIKQRKLEHKLAVERRRLFSILDGLPALVYLIAPDYSFRFSNKFFQERFQKPASDPCYMIFHGRTEPCESCVSFNNGEIIESLECNRTYPNGYTYETYNYPFNDVDGTEMLLSFGIDITERKHAEEALRKSESNLRKITDNMIDMIRHINNKGIIKYASPSHHNILGYMPEDIVGKFVHEIIHPDDIEKIRNTNRENVKANANLKGKLEYRLKHVDGHYIWVETIGNPIIEESGQVSGFIYCSRDITDRKHAEEALAISEDKFSKAFNSNPLAMAITTLEDGSFVNINKSFCRIFGARRQEILDRTALEIGFWSKPNDRNIIKDRIMSNEMVNDQEITFSTKIGERRIGLVYAERLDINGEACILSIIMDITERKEMEVEITRLDRLNMVGEMAASIGHEIRNPMTSVRGFLQMFGVKYTEDQEFLNLMIEELDRANAIISEFLSLAKNKMVKLIPNNINDILKNILPLVQANATIQDKYINLEVEKIPDLLIDEKEIRQLIFNLVYNGLESMSAGKKMIIKTYMENRNVVLAIQDQGHGMNPEVLSKLGTPFFTTKENGTGLGLAVCYGIAKRHNARIDIETSSNGTTFYIRFPMLNH